MPYVTADDGVPIYYTDQGAAACGGVAKDVQQRAEDEVRRHADEEIQRMRTLVENEVERGLTQPEEQVRKELQQQERQ